jgi:anti-sigma factor RsiW
MNCREIEEIAPLYLSGELEDDQRALVRTHLAQCRSCAGEIARQVALDARVLDAVSMPDVSRVERTVRRRIVRERVLRFAAVAAALVFAAFLGYRASRPAPVSRLYADAALDHRLEVIEHQPRRWRTDPAEIGKLAARYELTDLAALAPEGYRLEHAKMCGLEGKPALHLVYTNGTREVSVFVRARAGGEKVLREVSVGSEHLARFGTDRLEAIVAGGSSGECLEFARVGERGL